MSFHKIPREQRQYTSFLFRHFVEGAGERWLKNKFKAYLVTASSDMPDGTEESMDAWRPKLINTPVTIAGRRIVGAAADGNDVIFHDVPAGDLVVAILITEIDRRGIERPATQVGAAYGLPLWTNGGDIIVNWDNGPARIFRIDQAAELQQTPREAYSRLGLNISPMGVRA